LIRDDKTIPASLTRNINSAGEYEYQKRIGMGSSCIQVSDESILSNLEGKLNYEFNDDYQFSLDTKI
jgi:hypothetical protein